MAFHVTEQPLLGSIESEITAAMAAGMLADADFATDLPTTLANVATRNAAIPSTQYPRYLSLRRALEIAHANLGNTLFITDSATIKAAIDGDWGPGFSPSF